MSNPNDYGYSQGERSRESTALHQILVKIDDANSETKATRVSLSEMSNKISAMNVHVENLVAQGEKFSPLENRVTVIETKLQEHDSQATVARWLLGLIITVFIAILALAASHMNWH